MPKRASPRLDRWPVVDVRAGLDPAYSKFSKGASRPYGKSALYRFGWFTGISQNLRLDVKQINQLLGYQNGVYHGESIVRRIRGIGAA